jgi:hypothetical protein
MYGQWLHRYLQQFSKEIVPRELFGRGYTGAAKPCSGSGCTGTCNSFIKRSSHDKGLLSQVQAVVAPVPATVLSRDCLMRIIK